VAESIEVIGLGRAKALFDGGRLERRWAQGALRVGQDIAGDMKAAARPHHMSGRLEQQIHAEPFGTGMGMEVHVGISVGLAPEGRPIAFGWKSQSGKQPPSQAIADWIVRKGGLGATTNVTRTPAGFQRYRGTKAQISQESAVRSLAFLIARKIKAKGYSFGHDDWFHKGIEVGRLGIHATMSRYLRGQG
jgi:hypothetical protein